MRENKSAQSDVNFHCPINSFQIHSCLAIHQCCLIKKNHKYKINYGKSTSKSTFYATFAMQQKKSNKTITIFDNPSATALSFENHTAWKLQSAFPKEFFVHHILYKNQCTQFYRPFYTCTLALLWWANMNVKME